VYPAVPGVEAANYTDPAGCRGPYPEYNAVNIIDACAVGPEFVVKTVMSAAVKEIAVYFTQLRQKRIGICSGMNSLILYIYCFVSFITI
jgi:hypothetical protein